MTTKSSLVAIIGRPNVGKSSLVNQMLGEKISITSRRPQTTRDQILGVLTTGETQIVFVDTPGYHIGEKKRVALSERMNKEAKGALSGVNHVLWVVEAMKWTDDDVRLLDLMKKIDTPVIILINKVDKLKEKTALLPYLQAHGEDFSFAQEVIPVSAKKSYHLDTLVDILTQKAPLSPWMMPADMKTDKDLPFRIREIIREKLMRALGQELPYVTAVTLEQLKKTDKNYHIHAVVWVETEGQKSIVIGEGGHRLKEISIQARLSIEALMQMPVYLRLWVKVKSGWTDDMSSVSKFMSEE